MENNTEEYVEEKEEFPAPEQEIENPYPEE